MIVILMGVSGSGKSTVGELVARRLGCGFSDADAFHPPSNVAKMHAGVPLQDEDRQPWLAALRAAIEGWEATGEDHVVACSALKQAYRDALSPRGDVKFVFLKGSAEVIGPRLKARKGHYFDPALLASQFAALEEPTDDTIAVDIAQSADQVADEIVARLASARPAMDFQTGASADGRRSRKPR